jgi:hypothetical protein
VRPPSTSGGGGAAAAVVVSSKASNPLNPAACCSATFPGNGGCFVCDVPDAASKLQTKQGQITFVGSNIIAPMSVSAQQSTDGATIVVRVVVSPAERERERERDREQSRAESSGEHSSEPPHYERGVRSDCPLAIIYCARSPKSDTMVLGAMAQNNAAAPAAVDLLVVAAGGTADASMSSASAVQLQSDSPADANPSWY